MKILKSGKIKRTPKNNPEISQANKRELDERKMSRTRRTTGKQNQFNMNEKAITITETRSKVQWTDFLLSEGNQIITIQAGTEGI